MMKDLTMIDRNWMELFLQLGSFGILGYLAIWLTKTAPHWIAAIFEEHQRMLSTFASEQDRLRQCHEEQSEKLRNLFSVEIEKCRVDNRNQIEMMMERFEKDRNEIKQAIQKHKLSDGKA